MTSTCAPRTPPDYFSMSRKGTNYSIPSPSLDGDQSPYGGLSLASSTSCNSSDSSIGRLGRISPDTYQYALDPASVSLNIKSEPDTLSLSNNFDDWMRWDDSETNVLSASDLIDPLFSTLKFEATTPEMATLEEEPSANRLDSDSMDFVHSLNNEPLFPTPFSQNMELQDEATEELYSTPLSWEPPAPGRHQSQTKSSSTTRYNTTLVDSPRLTTVPTSKPSQIYDRLASPSSSEPASSDRKRNSSDGDESSTSPPPTSRLQPPKRTAHNMIEKRYRNNLNDKITALRDSVPSLRVAAEAQASTGRKSSKSSSKSSSSLHHYDMVQGNGRSEELEESLGPHPKLNKATVLSKATEYIAQLEKRSKNLSKENQQLKARIDAFETLLMGQNNVGRPIYEIGMKPERVLPPLQRGNSGGRW